MCTWAEADHVALFRHQECDGIHTFVAHKISQRGIRLSSTPVTSFHESAGASDRNHQRDPDETNASGRCVSEGRRSLCGRIPKRKSGVTVWIQLEHIQLALTSRRESRKWYSTKRQHVRREFLCTNALSWRINSCS